MDNRTFDDNKEIKRTTIDEQAITSENKHEIKQCDTIDISKTTESKNIVDIRAHESVQPMYTGNTYYNETIKGEKQSDTRKKPKKENKKKSGMAKFLAGVVVASMVGGTFAGVGFAFVLPYTNHVYAQKMSDKITGAEQGGNLESIKQEVQADFATPTNNTLKDVNVINPVPMIAESVGPSVVSIVNTKLVSTWGGEYSETGLGSGVIFEQDQEKVYIVSNAHVVEDATSLVVTFLGNYKVEADIVGYDTTTDIAVVSVDLVDIPQEIINEIKPAPIGDSDNIRVGEMAVAIGTPIDEAYNNTVTVGYISALDRQISLTDQTFNLIQTDAAINPGNSGGALVGEDGTVIGINTIKSVDSEIEGMGFAIPINDVKPIIEELMTYGRMIRPSLGIMGTTVQEALGEHWDIAVGIGIIEVIPGSSASVAGIQPGDVIINFDGLRIYKIEELQDQLQQKAVGDVVSIEVVRGNEKYEFEVILQELPQN